MDDDTVRLLEDLPEDFTARGWAFVPRESKIARTQTTTSYVTVYERPYHAPVDHLGTAITVRGGYIYVSTAQAQSASWDESRQAAIARMRAIDAPRQSRDKGRSWATVSPRMGPTYKGARTAFAPHTGLRATIPATIMPGQGSEAVAPPAGIWARLRRWWKGQRGWCRARWPC